MATTNFDRISIEVSRRIGDPVGAVGTNGKKLTADERNAYVNKALLKYYNDYWLTVKGDEDVFLSIFPELIVSTNVATDASGIYTLASPHLHLGKLIDAYGTTENKDVKVLPNHLYLIVKHGLNEMYKPSTTNYFAFFIGKTVQFLPSAQFNAKNADLIYIRQPIQSDGNFIVHTTGEDSPFYPHHNSAIAAIGEELIRIDFQYAR